MKQTFHDISKAADLSINQITNLEIHKQEGEMIQMHIRLDNSTASQVKVIMPQQINKMTAYAMINEK